MFVIRERLYAHPVHFERSGHLCGGEVTVRVLPNLQEPIGTPPQPVLCCSHLIDCTYLIKLSAFNKNSYRVAYFYLTVFFPQTVHVLVFQRITPLFSLQFNFHNYFQLRMQTHFVSSLFYFCPRNAAIESRTEWKITTA